jgi:3-deoxy-D-manno-octulosonic-acid transferase
VYSALRPRLLLLSELELWPNLLLEAGRRRIPVLVASSRINDRDLAFYRRINRWHRPALRWVTWWGAQTERDAERIHELLGPAHATRVVVTGSLKYDAAAGHARQPCAESLRALLGYSPGDRVLVAGSTHPPEEQMLLDLIRAVRMRHPELKLLIAPREPHRFPVVAQLIEQAGLSWVKRSDVAEPRPAPADVTLLDSAGELPRVWDVADLAFVGGTWARGIGGQSPIEPASLGKPVCFGPHVWNFEQPAQGLLDAGAAVRFQSPAQLQSLIGDWLTRPQLARDMGRAAAEYVQSQRGAAAATIAAITAHLGRNPPDQDDGSESASPTESRYS